MKNYKLFTLAAAASLMVVACGGQKTTSVSSADLGFSSSQIDSVSYAIGVSLGSMVEEARFGDIDMNEVRKGMEDVLNSRDLRIEKNQTGIIIQQYMMMRMTKIAEFNKAKGDEFLKKKGTEDGVQSTDSGLYYRITEPGSDLHPSLTDTVEVNYEGTLIDGKVFDSSYERNQTAKFPLNRVIKGWTEGLQLIGEGGKIELYIPAELAYGPQGAGPDIGPNETLIFKVELIKVSKDSKKEDKEAE